MQAVFLELFKWIPGYVASEVNLSALSETIIDAELSRGTTDSAYAAAAKSVIARAAVIFPNDAFIREAAIRLLNLTVQTHQ